MKVETACILEEKIQQAKEVNLAVKDIAEIIINNWSKKDVKNLISELVKI